MELGVYSFGDLQRDAATGNVRSTAEAIRNVVEAIKLADEVGLDYFGVGEHHRQELPIAVPSVVLAAAASVTRTIKLGSAVTVLSTDDPVRVYQQFATLDAVSHRRAEIIAGRGSFIESFALFGYNLADYDQLYAEKLELLLKINREERVTWQGRFRANLDDQLVVPRPEQGRLPIWLGTGGNPQSSIRAGQLGMPICYAIIGGDAARFAPLVTLYRRAAQQAGVAAEQINVGVATPGYIAPDGAAAKQQWYEHWSTIMRAISRERGFAPPNRAQFMHEASGQGALFVGEPAEIAERIITLHYQLGHTRQALQMDVGNLPQRDFLRAIELLGTQVKPLVEAELGSATAKKHKELE